MSSIQSKVFSGAALMVLLRMLVKSMGMISTVILARLLVPEDFGLIALAMSVYALIELINAFGFDIALIQNQKANKSHYDTVWTIKLIFGVLAGIIMVAIASPVSVFYDDIRLTDVFYYLSFMFVINGLSNVGTVNFRKALDFKKEFQFEFAIKFSSVLFTISLAFYLRSYQALLFGMLFNSAARVLLSYIMSDFRPTLNLSKLKEIFSFSIWLLINNILNYLNTKSKDLIIGKYSGVGNVGLYSISDEFANLPSTEFVASVNRATYPGYAKVSENLLELKELYINVLSTIATLGIPASIGIALIAPIFVPVVLGESWYSAVPILFWLSLASSIICVNTNVGYVFMALGKPKVTTALLLTRVIIFLTLIVYMTKNFGLLGAAQSVLMTSVIVFPLFTYAICKELAIPVRSYLIAIYKPACSSLVMFLSVSYFYYGEISLVLFQSHIDGTIIDLLFTILLGFIFYAVTHFALWVLEGKPKGIEASLILKLKSLIK